MKVPRPGQFLDTARISVTAVRENVPVLALTGVAFGASYGHIAKLCGDYGPHGWVQYATAGCVDLLCVIGAEERQRDKRIGRARNGRWVTWPTVILFTGILVTLAANAATADRHFLGYCVAAWPAAALLLAVSILERRAAHEIPIRIEQSELQAELSALQSELESEQAARQDAEAGSETARAEAASAARAAAEAVAKAEDLARKLADATRKQHRKPPSRPAGNPSGNGSRETDPVTVPGEEPPEDLDSEARVLWFLAKGYSASQAGIKAGLTDSRGRQIARVAREAPKGIDEGGSS